MSETERDYVLVGGGLQSGLVALALCARPRPPRLAIIEQGDRLGGNHTWCFHDADVPPSLRAVVAPLVVNRWDGYSVRFPGRTRRLALPYAAVTSERLDAIVRERIAAAGGAVLLGRRVTEVGARDVVLEGGAQIAARAVIDARGPSPSDAGGATGYQKFLGLELILTSPHGLGEPVLMDATVEQIDGYRFVYTLPLDPTRLLVEDTYFSDGARLDVEALRARVLDYARALDLRIARIAREETGILPMPWSGGPTPRAAAPLVAGHRGGFFHPATGYSFAVAARLAEAIAQVGPGGIDGRVIADLAAGLRRRARFARALNRLLFRWFAPAERWHVLDRFYRLPEEVIGRFYALELTTVDQARLLLGAPPRGLSLQNRLRSDSA